MSDVDHAKELREWLDEAKHGALTAPERRRAASHIKAMESEIAALKADNAALLEDALPHVSACDYQGTAAGTCSENPSTRPCATCARRADLMAHPGAALLERMKRLEDIAKAAASVACESRVLVDEPDCGDCGPCLAREALKP